MVAGVGRFVRRSCALMRCAPSSRMEAPARAGVPLRIGASCSAGDCASVHADRSTGIRDLGAGLSVFQRLVCVRTVHMCSFNEQALRFIRWITL